MLLEFADENESPHFDAPAEIMASASIRLSNHRACPAPWTARSLLQLSSFSSLLLSHNAVDALAAHCGWRRESGCASDSVVSLKYGILFSAARVFLLNQGEYDARHAGHSFEDEYLHL